MFDRQEQVLVILTTNPLQTSTNLYLMHQRDYLLYKVVGNMITVNQLLYSLNYLYYLIPFA